MPYNSESNGPVVLGFSKQKGRYFWEAVAFGWLKTFVQKESYRKSQKTQTPNKRN